MLTAAMICKISLQVLILVVIATPVIAQGNDDFGFTYSYATFVEEDSLQVVELSYSFEENGISFKNGRGQLIVEAVLQNSLGEDFGSFLWTIDREIVGTEPTSKLLGGIQRFLLPEGQYDCELKLTDAINPKRRASTKFTIYVRSMSTSKIGLSDIELIHEMAPKQKNKNPFQRGEYVLIRNITGIVGPPSYSLKTYVEMYGTDLVEASQFEISWFIANMEGNVLFRHDTLLNASSSNRRFYVEELSIENLPDGTYVLAVRLFNAPRALSNDSVEVVRIFEKVSPKWQHIVLGDSASNSDNSSFRLIDPEYQGLTEGELDVKYQQAKFIMNEVRKRIWSGLDGLKPKGRFLTRFWLATDPDPSTPQNEFKDEYEELLDHASRLYSSVSAPKGWDSDRGRIILTHGKPDIFQRFPNEQNRKPYEIWRYNSLGYDFVFVDMGQVGHYIMVHSNAPNEIRDPNWLVDRATVFKGWYDGESDTDGTGDY